MFKNGQIVGVHGRNISISIDQSEVHLQNDQIPSYLSIVLPALNKRDIDYAVEHIAEFQNFGSTSGYIWFPKAYDSNTILPGKRGDDDYLISTETK